MSQIHRIMRFEFFHLLGGCRLGIFWRGIFCGPRHGGLAAGGRPSGRSNNTEQDGSRGAGALPTHAATSSGSPVVAGRSRRRCGVNRRAAASQHCDANDVHGHRAVRTRRIARRFEHDDAFGQPFTVGPERNAAASRSSRIHAAVCSCRADRKHQHCRDVVRSPAALRAEIRLPIVVGLRGFAVEHTISSADCREAVSIANFVSIIQRSRPRQSHCNARRQARSWRIYDAHVEQQENSKPRGAVVP